MVQRQRLILEGGSEGRGNLYKTLRSVIKYFREVQNYTSNPVFQRKIWVLPMQHTCKCIQAACSLKVITTRIQGLICCMIGLGQKITSGENCIIPVLAVKHSGPATPNQSAIQYIKMDLDMFIDLFKALCCLAHML